MTSPPRKRRNRSVGSTKSSACAEGSSMPKCSPLARVLVLEPAGILLDRLLGFPAGFPAEGTLGGGHVGAGVVLVEAADLGGHFEVVGGLVVLGDAQGAPEGGEDLVETGGDAGAEVVDAGLGVFAGGFAQARDQVYI